MISKDQAKKSVEAELQRGYQIPDDTYVIIEDLTIEKPFAWIFFYNSKKYLKTGDFNDVIAGNGPVFVNKHNGVIEFCGSRKSLDELLLEYERKWG